MENLATKSYRLRPESHQLCVYRENNRVGSQAKERNKVMQAQKFSHLGHSKADREIWTDCLDSSHFLDAISLRFLCLFKINFPLFLEPALVGFCSFHWESPDMNRTDELFLVILYFFFLSGKFFSPLKFLLC